MILNNKKRLKPYVISLQKFTAQLVFLICLFNAVPRVLWAHDPIKTSDKQTSPLIKFYQEHISGIDGNRCPMYPHCSQYCALAVQKHGFPMGWIMACDRLVRCGRDEVRLSPHIKLKGRELTLDPVSANDFWWFSPEAETAKPKINSEDSNSEWLQNWSPDQRK